MEALIRLSSWLDFGCIVKSDNKGTLTLIVGYSWNRAGIQMEARQKPTIIYVEHYIVKNYIYIPVRFEPAEGNPTTHRLSRNVA